MSAIQLTGQVKFGTTSSTVHCSDVTSAIFKRTYNQVTMPATFSNLNEYMVPGTFTNELTITYTDDDSFTATDTLAGLVSAAMLNATPSTTLYFDFLPEGSASAAHKRISGVCNVFDVEKGGKPGELRERTVTVSCYNVTFNAS